MKKLIPALRNFFIVGAIVAGFFSAPLVRADETAAARWAKMPEPDRARIRENYSKFKALPESEKQEVRARVQKFRSLPPERRSTIRDRYRKFKAKRSSANASKNFTSFLRKNARSASIAGNSCTRKLPIIMKIAKNNAKNARFSA